MALFDDKDTSNIMAAWATMVYKTWTETFTAWAHQLMKKDDELTISEELPQSQWSVKPAEKRLFPFPDPTWALMRWSGRLNMKLQQYTQEYWAAPSTGKFATWLLISISVITVLFMLAANIALTAGAGMAVAWPWFVIGALATLVSLGFMPSDAVRSTLIVALIGVVSFFTTLAWTLVKTVLNLTLVPFMGLLRAGFNLVKEAFHEKDALNDPSDLKKATWLRRLLSGFAMLAGLTAGGLMFFVFGIPLSMFTTLLFVPIMLFTALSLPVPMIADKARSLLNKLPWLALGLVAVGVISFLFLHLFLGFTVIPGIGLSLVSLGLYAFASAAITVALFFVAGTGRMAQWFWSAGFNLLKDKADDLKDAMSLLVGKLQRAWTSLLENPKQALMLLGVIAGVLAVAATVVFYFVPALGVKQGTTILGFKIAGIAAAAGAGGGAVLALGLGLALLGLAGYGCYKGAKRLFPSKAAKAASIDKAIANLPTPTVNPTYENNQGVESCRRLIQAIEKQQAAGAMKPSQVVELNQLKGRFDALCHWTKQPGLTPQREQAHKASFAELAKDLKTLAKTLGIAVTYEAQRPVRAQGGLQALPVAPVVAPAPGAAPVVAAPVAAPVVAAPVAAPVVAAPVAAPVVAAPVAAPVVAAPVAAPVVAAPVAAPVVQAAAKPVVQPAAKQPAATMSVPQSRSASAAEPKPPVRTVMPSGSSIEELPDSLTSQPVKQRAPAGQRAPR